MVVIVQYPDSNKYGICSGYVENSQRMEVSTCLQRITSISPIYVETIFNVNGEVEFIQTLGYTSIESPMECIILQDRKC